MLRYIFRKSVKAQLIALSVGVVTALMVAFGAYSYVLTQQSFLQQQDAAQALLTQQLAAPASNAFWNYDDAAMGALLSSALGGSVRELVAYTADDQEFARRRTTTPDTHSILPAPMREFEIQVPAVAGRAVGRIQVTWSDEPLRVALNATLRRTLFEIVLLNVVLVGFIWFAVDRLVFRRTAVLQKALDFATTRVDAADIVAIPVEVPDEFGALTHSINAITKRLGDEIEAGHVAEREALAALSELQSAQDGLVRAEKMASLGRLVAGVAHELNTPIGNIVMVASTQQELSEQFVQQLEAGNVTRSALSQFVKSNLDAAVLLQRASARAATLIQNFKQVAVDQTTDQLREFDLAVQLTEVLSVISPEISKAHVTLQCEFAPGIVMRTYPGPLGQVVTNLVINALRHGFDLQQPGVITVKSAMEKDVVSIAVTDTGGGISPDNMGKIFDPFFTTKLGKGGTGLGLHISHNIVFGPLGGSMTVASELGVGTTFSLLLPRQVAVD